MRVRLALLLLFPLCLLSLGCSSMHVTSVRGQSTTLAVHSSPSGANGERTIYKVLPGRNGGDPQIQRSATRQVRRALLGIRTSDLDDGVAKALRAPAWGGVSVQSVEPGSGAALGDLRVGDLLILVNEMQVQSRRQLDTLIEDHLQADVEAVLVVERWIDDDQGSRRERVELRVTPGARSVLDEITDAFRLKTAPGVQRLTGLQAASVPPDLSAEIWGTTDNSSVLVSGVVSGSPAYLAGFRGGDRVLSVNGRPVRDLEQLVEAVAARAQARGFGLSADEMPQSGLMISATTAPLQLVVDGPLGRHEKEVKLRDDLGRVVDFWSPIVFDYDGSVDHTRWSFLDFIFQFGANSWHRYEPSKTREPASSSTLSLLPFGMFEFTSTPSGSTNTLFWFIDWTSRN